jgi:hypothetical protein
LPDQNEIVPALEYPSYRTIQGAERVVGGKPGSGMSGPAYSAEGVARCHARKTLGDPEAEVDEAALHEYWPRTAEDLAKELHQTWNHLEATWGTRFGGAVSN